MIKKKIWIVSQNRFVTLRLSARGLKTLDKHGTEYLIEKGVI
jgi:ribosomal protein L28